MRPTAIIMLAVGLFCATGARARSLADLGIRGALTYDLFGHRDDLGVDDAVRHELAVDLEWEQRLGRRFQIRTDLRARVDSDELVSGFYGSEDERDPQRSSLLLQGLELKYRGDSWQFKLGKQTYAWGSADAFNPVDLLNPSDYLDAVAYEDMGIWSASVRTQIGEIDLEGVWSPWFVQSRLPNQEGRWRTAPDFESPFADMPIIAILVDLVPGFFPPLQPVISTDYPDGGLEQSQFGARAQTTLAGWDLSAYFYDGYPHVPEVRIEGLSVQLIYPHMRVYGAGFSTTWEWLEMHGQAAFTDTSVKPDVTVRGDRVNWIAGVNATWTPDDSRLVENVITLLEYARETALESQPDGGELPELGSAADAFLDTVAARVQVGFVEDTRASIFTAVDLSGSASALIRVELSRQLDERWYVGAEFDVFEGPSEEFWGRWGHNDRVRVTTRCFF